MRIPHVRTRIPDTRRGLAVAVAVAVVAAATGLSAGPGPASAAAIAGSVATAAASPLTAIGSRPATRDAPVPTNIRPSLSRAARDYPKPYFDGCHVEQDGGLPADGGCLYGKVNSKTTIALFGDSHALSWFPAVERLAIDKGWRLISLTMSACTPAEIPAYMPRNHSVSWACAEWRDAALGLLEQVHPAVIIAAGTRGFATVDDAGNLLTGSARTAAWEAGVERTVDRLKEAGGRVIWMADTPIARVDPPICLARHLRSTLACATPVSYAVNQVWLSEEHYMTQIEDVGFIDPSLWICPTSPCPAVIGRVQVYRDAGHMTATFMATLAKRLEKAVATDLAAHPNG